MDHYIDIRVLPDPEFQETILLNALYAKLHRALYDVGQGEIGISFPRLLASNRTLGDLLRLHGTADALARLMAHDWLKGLREYTRASAPAPVPAHAQHRAPTRRQFKSNPERLLRRSLNKGWINQAQMQERLAQTSPRHTNAPFLQVKSRSNGHEFRLFVVPGSVQQQAVAGKFNHYGLSDQATVPWF